MKQWFLTTWNEIKIGKNLDVYLTLLVAIVILFIDIFGQPEASAISEATLLVLSIFAYNMISNRRQSDKIEALLNRIDAPQDSIGNFLKQQYDHSDLEKRLRVSNEAFSGDLLLLELSHSLKMK